MDSHLHSFRLSGISLNLTSSHYIKKTRLVANKAYISLVPTGAQTLDEFRPISVITGVIKIISKILALRLPFTKF